MTNGKVVCDASVSAKWGLNEDLSNVALDLLDEWTESRIEITVPPLWEYELESIIRHHVYRGQLASPQSEQVYAALHAVQVKVRYFPSICLRARQIAIQANQRHIYDSVYAAHAEAEKCDLWTADFEYFKAVRGFLGYVHYLGDHQLLT